MNAIFRYGGTLVLTALVISAASSQERAQQRRAWIAPGTLVSDDPRRVPVAPGPRGPEGTLVLRGGRVFDGTGTPVFQGTVVIERNKIKAILPPASTAWPADARIVDVSGQTVMPGLIDLHTHLTNPESSVSATEAQDPSAATLRGAERLRYYIESGITSVRDVASMGVVPFRLKSWVAENRIPGPRIFAAGQLITGTGGHGAEGMEFALHPSAAGNDIRVASGPDDWREAVREQFGRGADLIKLASHYSREEIKAAVEEAHALGLKVTVDAETFYIQWAVEAGVDSVEHPLPRTEETIELMARRQVASVPTLVAYKYIFDQSGGYFDSTSRRFTFSKEANLELFRRMKRAGIKLGVGTDLVDNWFRYLPQAYITELEQFVAGGYTVPQALVAATRTSAEILDMDDRLGTLIPGKLADATVIDGRPDQNLEDLAKVSMVVRDGRIVVAGGNVSIPRHVPIPEPEAVGAGSLTPAEVLKNSVPSDWRSLDPESTLYMELPLGRVVIEMAADFAPLHVANIKTLVREGYFDGLAILRVQDNYVTQWGDPDEDNTAGRARPIGTAKTAIAPEFTVASMSQMAFTRLPDVDPYASEVGFFNGFPVARDPRTGRAWLAHCYGAIGVGRDDAADSGSGASLYAVIGQSPRQLDRNTTVVGRVIQGIELLSSLPRGTGELGYYQKPEERLTIKAIRLASEVSLADRSKLEVMRTDSQAFSAWVEALRNRRGDWYKVPAGNIELCNVAIPVRAQAAR